MRNVDEELWVCHLGLLPTPDGLAQTGLQRQRLSQSDDAVHSLFATDPAWASAA